MPAETYLAGLSAVATVNGTAMAVEDGSYTTQTDVDEMTNSKSNGFYEDIGTISKATANLKCIYEGASPPAFKRGDLITLAITSAGPGISGTFRVNKLNKKLTVKGGIRFDFDVTSQGAFTETN